VPIAFCLSGGVCHSHAQQLGEIVIVIRVDVREIAVLLDLSTRFSNPLPSRAPIVLGSGISQLSNGHEQRLHCMAAPTPRTWSLLPTCVDHVHQIVHNGVLGAAGIEARAEHLANLGAEGEPKPSRLASSSRPPGQRNRITCSANIICLIALPGRSSRSLLRCTTPGIAHCRSPSRAIGAPRPAPIEQDRQRSSPHHRCCRCQYT
jgi:hypothetical protein